MDGSESLLSGQQDDLKGTLLPSTAASLQGGQSTFATSRFDSTAGFGETGTSKSSKSKSPGKTKTANKQKLTPALEHEQKPWNNSISTKGKLQSHVKGCPDLLEVLHGPTNADIKGNTANVPFWTTLGVPAVAVRSGRWYYEVKLEGAMDPQIGWGDRTFLEEGHDPRIGVGDDDHSWGIDGSRGVLWHKGHYGAYNQRWPEKVTIGCAVSLREGMMMFSVNGKWEKTPSFQGVAFTDMLYPAVSGEFATIKFALTPLEMKYPVPGTFLPLVPCTFLNGCNQQNLIALKNVVPVLRIPPGALRERLLGHQDETPEQKLSRQLAQAEKDKNRMKNKRIRDKVTAFNSLLHFREFLKSQYGHLFRAWRRCLDIDGEMILQKAAVFKFCKHAGWTGDVRSLWRALDPHSHNRTTLVELDTKFARVLACFQQWQAAKWDSAEKCFKVLDSAMAHQLALEEFQERCRHFGFEGNTRQLFAGLDTENKKYVCENDFKCLNVYSPPAWLTAKASKEAVEAFKSLLKKKYGHLFKGFRLCLDKDSSNCVSFEEYMIACKTLGFSDAANAWMVLDDDGSGFVTYSELDPEEAETLMDFKNWAVKQYGSVAAAFKALDQDGGGQLSHLEFCDGARQIGFEGDAEFLFEVMDLDLEGQLQKDEVTFLDDWVVVDMPESEMKHVDPNSAHNQAKEKKKEERKAYLAHAKEKWEKRRRMKGRVASMTAFHDFQMHLRKKFGHSFHAWRKIFSKEESKDGVSKQDFLVNIRKVVRWTGDLTALWRGLDSKNNGSLSYDELDPKFSRQLAQFKAFLKEHFTTQTEAFKGFTKKKELHQKLFEDRCKKLGWTGDLQFNLQEIYWGLDVDEKKFLRETDLYCLDNFEVPALITTEANYKSSKKYKSALLRHYKHFLRAWREGLDKESCNCVCFLDFQECAKTIEFDGDVMAAWVAFDPEQFGYMTFADIDDAACTALLQFKTFVECHRDGIEAFFEKMDEDGAGQLERADFLDKERWAELWEGFEGNLELVFDTFDIDKSGAICIDDIIFLQDWEPVDLPDGVERKKYDVAAEARKPAKSKKGGTSKAAEDKSDDEDGETSKTASKKVHARKKGVRNPVMPDSGSDNSSLENAGDKEVQSKGLSKGKGKKGKKKRTTKEAEEEEKTTKKEEEEQEDKDKEKDEQAEKEEAVNKEDNGEEKDKDAKKNDENGNEQEVGKEEGV